jgi:hypothetical protein
MTSNDQTISPGGYDANGNPLDVNGNPIPPGQQGGQRTGQQGGQQPGQQQPGQQNKGLLGGLLGGNNTTDNSSGGSGLLGTLGMLAAGAGAGYLLSNLLSNKSSTGTATVAPAQAATIAPGNLQFNKLASPAPITVNPISAQTPGPMPTNLGQLISPTNIQTINPQTLAPVAPQGH